MTTTTHNPILESAPLGPRWPCLDPFLFCAHHDDSYPASDGKMGVQAVELEGRELSTLPDAERGRVRNRSLGFVYQFHHLLPEFTALENVAMPLLIRGTPIAGARGQSQALLERVGLKSHAHKYPIQLSGGQQQRVAIARALAMDPIAMLFDEPTSALDPEMVNEVLDVMVELAGEGMTMMCVTHEMGFARKVADRIVFMDGGEIIEDVKSEEFFSAPRSDRARSFLSKILQH